MKPKRQLAKEKRQKVLASRLPRVDQWCGWFDGSAHPNPGRCGIGALLRAPDGRQWQLSRDVGYGDSSEAEYQALIALLELAKELECVDLLIFGDSRVVLDDVQFNALKTAACLREFRLQAQELMRQFDCLELRWIPRARNAEADALSQAVFV